MTKTLNKFVNKIIKYSFNVKDMYLFINSPNLILFLSKFFLKLDNK